MKFRIAASSVVLAVCLLVALPGPATASASSWYETNVINATNKHRVAHDKVKLQSSACVDSYAEKWAKWMADHQTMKHQSMSKILSACNLTHVGENIAYGYPNGTATVNAWMKSSGHRKNILKSVYRQIGVGAYQDEDGRWWVSQVFGTKR